MPKGEWTVYQIHQDYTSTEAAALMARALEHGLSVPALIKRVALQAVGREWNPLTNGRIKGKKKVVRVGAAKKRRATRSKKASKK